MPCRVNTALNKHGRCIAYDSAQKTHSVVVVSCGDVYTESGSAGVDTVQGKDGRLWKENRRVLSRSLLRTCDL